MSDITKEEIKFITEWLNANVHDGEDRSGTKDTLVFNPDDLHELCVDLVEYVLFRKSSPEKSDNDRCVNYEGDGD